MSSVWTRFYYGLSITASILATLCMALSFATSNWEIMTYNQERALTLAGRSHTLEVNYIEAPAGASGDGYLQIIENVDEEHNNSNSDNSDHGNATYTYVPIKCFSGLWTNCDTNDDATQAYLEELPDGSSYNKCTSYIEMDNAQDIGLLVSLSRSAVACAIVVIITMFVSNCLGLFAAARQQIVFAMITGVCYFAASIYTFFTATLMLLRKNELQRSTLGYLPGAVVHARTMASSWSMYVCWGTIFMCIGCGMSWLLLSTQLKRARTNYMYTSQYDQICSM